MTYRLLCFVTAIQLTALSAAAHPVAQGAMEIVVRADRLDVRARVSNEEAFVAEAFGGNADAKATLDYVWRMHGEYLLAHLHVTADGLPLTGQVADFTPPKVTTPEGRIGY